MSDDGEGVQTDGASAGMPGQPTEKPATDAWGMFELAMPEGMVGDAAIRFHECVKRFAAALSRETSRLELDLRDKAETQPAITPTMVLRADDAVRNPVLPQTRTPLWGIVCVTGIVPSGIIAGVFGSYLDHWWDWLGLVLFILIAVFCQIMAFVTIRSRS